MVICLTSCLKVVVGCVFIVFACVRASELLLLSTAAAVDVYFGRRGRESGGFYGIGLKLND